MSYRIVQAEQVNHVHLEKILSLLSKLTSDRDTLCVF